MDRRSIDLNAVLRRELTRRDVLKLGAFAGGSAMLAACQVGGSASSTPGGSGGQSFAGKTVRVQTGGETQIVAELAKPLWEQATGGKVELEFTAFGERAQKYASIVATEDPTFDVIHLEGPFGGTLGDSLYEDLTPWLGDTSDFIPATITSLTWEGKLLAAPVYALVMFYMYNKQYYEDAGLDPENLPSTWDELYDVADALRADDRYAFLAGWLSGPYYTANLFLSYLNATSATAIDAAGTGVGFDNDDGLLAFRTLKRGFDTNFFDPNGMATATLEDSAILFNQGLTASVFAFPSHFAWARSEDVENYSALLDPDVVGAKIMPGIKSGTSGSINGYEGFGLNRFGTQKEAAVSFIKYVVSPEFQKVMNLQGVTGFPSTRLSVVNDAEVAEAYPLGEVLAAQGAYNVANYNYPFDWYPAVELAVRNMHDGVWSAEQAHEEAVKGVTETIAKYQAG
jgi:multiple sugar transport system substrate-binding protein